MSPPRPQVLPRRHHAGSVSTPTPLGLCRLPTPSGIHPQTWASSAPPRVRSPEGWILKRKQSSVPGCPVSPNSSGPSSRTQVLRLPGEDLPGLFQRLSVCSDPINHMHQ